MNETTNEIMNENKTIGRNANETTNETTNEIMNENKTIGRNATTKTIQPIKMNKTL